ncbi:MAG: hypothetical protein ACJASO_001677 [Cyclobacteriaceae bacterium]|jgi:hypothetical protein
MSKNSKINHDFLSQYSAVFADKLLQAAFEDKPRLSGKDILNLSKIKQLNLFIIKAFFTQWQEEVKKLESPLFDYSHKEVRTTMVNFMNILSQHISISQKNLKPYVEAALLETLTLTHDPGIYLAQELIQYKGNRLNARHIKSVTKYANTFKTALSELLASAEGEAVRDVIAKAELFFEDFETEEEMSSLLQEMSEILVVSENDMLLPTFQSSQQEEHDIIDEEDDEEVTDDLDSPDSTESFNEENQEVEEAQSDEPRQELEDEEPADWNQEEPDETTVEEESESHSFEMSNEVEGEITSEEEEAYEEEINEEGTDYSDAFNDEADDQDLVEEEEESKPESFGVSVEDEEEQESSDDVDEQKQLTEASNLAIEEVEEEQLPVNESFDEGHKTLAELHEEKQINSVFDAISINHRYMFLQELFDGDNELFAAALKDVDKCSSFDQAVEMLVQSYAKDYFWDMNSDEVKELLKVIYRKFRES